MAKINYLAEKRAKTLRMVQIALLAALEVILTLVYIPIGTINLNFGLVPIVVAGMFVSPLAGALIGGVSGVVTMIQVISGQSIFYVFLMSANPVAACILCIVKTAAAGYLVGLVSLLLRGILKSETLNALIVAALCPIVNTGIFALGMFTIFGNSLVSDPVISTWTADGLFALVFVVLIGWNFFFELGVTCLVAPVLSKALSSFLKKN